MLSHDLILDAAEQVIRAQLGAVSFLQRRVRVGFSTAGQLLFALEDMGIVAPSDGTSRAREVLVATFDRAAVLAAIDRAVADGRFVLDGEPCSACRPPSTAATPVQARQTT